jgi:predicted AAA+ superfamily ATPase
MADDDAENALLDGLRRHNPWWSAGADAGVFERLPRRPRSDFYQLVRPDEPESQLSAADVVALVGRGGVGKTTLLYEFVRHEVTERDVAPERFLYLPFDADPLYQLRSAEQLRRAVGYYDSRVLSRAADGEAGEDAGSHFLLVDDVHRIEHRSKPGATGWGEPLARLVAGRPGRSAVVTATAGVQIGRELDGVEPAPSTDVQPILPEKFRDYVFSLYPDLEADESRRVSPTSLRRGEGSLPRALRTGAVEPFVAELREKRERVGDDARRIRSVVVDYLAMGGVVAYGEDGPVSDATRLDPAAFGRVRDDVRNALYQDVPAVESIRTPADLERLCGLAARSRGEALAYRSLADLFEVDRRTLTDSYLPALSALYLLTAPTEYDNDRPRRVRLYLRDTGLVTALSGTEPATVRDDLDVEAAYARVAGYDHAMRLAYGLNAAQGVDPEAALPVPFWEADEGVVDYVVSVDDEPVPVALAYRPGTVETARAALAAFRRRYDAPVGLLVTAEAAARSTPAIGHEDGIVGLPYWLYLLLC